MRVEGSATEQRKGSCQAEAQRVRVELKTG